MRAPPLDVSADLLERAQVDAGERGLVDVRELRRGTGATTRAGMSRSALPSSRRATSPGVRRVETVAARRRCREIEPSDTIWSPDVTGRTAVAPAIGANMHVAACRGPRP